MCPASHSGRICVGGTSLRLWATQSHQYSVCSNMFKRCSLAVNIVFDHNTLSFPLAWLAMTCRAHGFPGLLVSVLAYTKSPCRALTKLLQNTLRDERLQLLISTAASTMASTASTDKCTSLALHSHDEGCSLANSKASSLVKCRLIQFVDKLAFARSGLFKLAVGCLRSLQWRKFRQRTLAKVSALRLRLHCSHDTLVRRDRQLHGEVVACLVATPQRHVALRSDDLGCLATAQDLIAVACVQSTQGLLTCRLAVACCRVGHLTRRATLQSLG